MAMDDLPQHKMELMKKINQRNSKRNENNERKKGT